MRAQTDLDSNADLKASGFESGDRGSLHRGTRRFSLNSAKLFDARRPY